jgi:hypothetical protein
MAGRFAKGTLLKMGDGGSPEGFTTIGEVRSISGPAVNVTVVDTTTHSTAGNYREKAPVLIDAGKATFEVNFNPDDPTLNPTLDTSVWGTMDQLLTVNFELHFSPANPNNQVMHFAGFVTEHGFNFPVDNVQTANIGIEISGRPTWT